MSWDKKKARLQRLIANDTGILRIRDERLDDFAQKRAREIRAELDPRSTDAPTHRGWLPNNGQPTAWHTYWDELPDGVSTFGENLTWNYMFRDSIRAAQRGWRNSTLHWQNETNLRFSHLGIGITRKILPGDEENPLAWRWYYAVIFTDNPN